MTNRTRSLWRRARSLVDTRDDRGATVVEIAIIAAGLATLALAIMAAITTLVDGQLPAISG